MSALMGTSVAELVTLLQKRDGRLPFEIGAFIALETCEKGDVKKEELVRIIMTKKKELRAWKDGDFQTRFMRIAAKL